MGAAKLAVIVPVFNAEDYLETCIKSICNQSMQELEIILVDDGSTDRSPHICDDFGKRDSRIKVIHKRNEGTIKARRAGVRAASTAFVGFVDADDWIDENMYEKLMECIEREDVEMAFCDIYRSFSEGDIRYDKGMFHEYGRYDRDKIEKVLYKDMLWKEEKNFYGIDTALWNKIYRKEIIEKWQNKIADYTFHYGEDIAIFYPVMLETVSLYYLGEGLYYQRQRPRGEVPGYIQTERYFQGLSELHGYLYRVFNEKGWLGEMGRQLDFWYMYSACLKRTCYALPPVTESPYMFPFGRVERGSKTVLYGAGDIGKIYYKQNKQCEYCDIVLWADRNAQKYQNQGMQVFMPEKIKDVEYDYIVVANASEEIKQTIGNRLKNQGISKEKLIL